MISSAKQEIIRVWVIFLITDIFFQNSILTIYNGGSSKDEILGLWSSMADFFSTPIKDSGNQIFIMITSDGHLSGKNFSASIKYGIRQIIYIMFFFRSYSMAGNSIVFLSYL